MGEKISLTFLLNSSDLNKGTVFPYMSKYVLLQHHQRKDTGFTVIERIKQLQKIFLKDNEMHFPSQNQMTTVFIKGSEAHPYLNIFQTAPDSPST